MAIYTLLLLYMHACLPKLLRSFSSFRIPCFQRTESCSTFAPAAPIHRETSAMASEAVIYEEISFPRTIVSPSTSNSLVLLGTGLTDNVIHFLQVKFYAIGVYAEPEIASHLQHWKGKDISELLAEDSGFFDDFHKAPVEKLVKVVIFKEVKGSQHISSLYYPVRDRLAEDDKFEEEEEEALENLITFFQTKSWLKKDTTLYYHFVSPSSLQISVTEDGNLPAQPEHTVQNANLVNGFADVFVGVHCVTPTLQSSLAEGIGKLL